MIQSQQRKKRGYYTYELIIFSTYVKILLFKPDVFVSIRTND